MRIGQLAKATGVPVDTLRYYERMQLLESPTRSAAGYRSFSSEATRQVRFIRRAKRLGFSLAEIADLLQLDREREQNACADVKRRTGEKLHDIEQRIAELQAIERSLRALHDSCCGGGESAADCSILRALDQDDARAEEH